MTWQCLELLNREDEDLDEMWRAAWNAAYTSTQRVAGNAIFRKSGRRPAMYFSPQAEELGTAFGARECQAPSAEKLLLVAGDEGAWELYFPGCPQHAQTDRRRIEASSGFDQPFESTYPSVFDEAFRPTQPSRI